METINWTSSLIEKGIKKIYLKREDFLGELRDLINSYSNLNLTSYDYDLIAGDWLENFTESIYLAWQEIISGYDKFQIKEIKQINSLTVNQYALKNFFWHEHLRWVVFNVTQGLKVDNSIFKDEKYLSNSKKTISYNMRRSIKNFISELNFNSDSKVLLYSPGFRCGNKEKFKFLFDCRKIVSLLNVDQFNNISPDRDWKWRLDRSNNHIFNGTFPSLVFQLLPLYVPSEILEGFNINRLKALSLNIKIPNAIFTTTGLSDSPSIGFLMTEWRQKGTKLLIHQHGGGYGCEKYQNIEKFEKRNSDFFFTWGKRESSNQTSYLSPSSPSFMWRTKKSGENILFLCNDHTDYPYRMLIEPWCLANKKMHEDIVIFFQCLKIRKNLFIRDHVHRSKWNFLYSENPSIRDLNFDKEKNIFNSYLNAKVTVHHLLSTTYLETLGNNIPTICFYDKSTKIFDEKAQKIINLLSEVGIIYEDSKSAARFLNKNYSNIESWWRSSDVQTARYKFIQRYALFSKNWKSSWKELFQSLV